MTSSTHLVLIPSHDAGPALPRTVAEALARWRPVWVVIDGGSDTLPPMPGLRVLRLPRRRGKGAAVRHGLEHAETAGFTHALVMDADGQHPAACIEGFMRASWERPEAMILGQPRFGPEAPWLRVTWRRLSNWLVRLETGGRLRGDSLFGFRVYPIAPLLRIMRGRRWMRGFDFDAEAIVRLCRAGVPAAWREAPVRYPTPGEGGVSHFRYGRHNLLLGWMHLRLLAEGLRRRR